MPHPETQAPMAQPHPTPQKLDSPNANPNGTAQKTADLTKRCACTVNSTSTLRHLTFPDVSTLFHTNLTRHLFIRNHLQKLPPMAAALAPYCGRLRTVADGCGRRDNSSRTRLYPQTPRVKREPFATHSGKSKNDYLKKKVTLSTVDPSHGSWSPLLR